MKKLALFLVACVALLGATADVAAQPWASLTAATSTGAGTSITLRSPGAQAQVFSAAGSSGAVAIRCSHNGTNWTTVATVIDPSATGEVWQGAACPYMSAYFTRSSGTVSAYFNSLSTNPGAWAQIAGTSSTPGYHMMTCSWTNAQVVAGGSGGTSYNFPCGTLPAKSRVLATYLTNDTQATFAAGTLTASVGVAGTAFADWIIASDLKATAATLYGNAVAERGASNIDGQLYYSTASAVYVQFLAGAGDLANVTASTGTVKIEYVTYP